MTNKILIACEFSGIVRDAFIRVGKPAVSCDLLPTESPGPHYQCDVLQLIEDNHFDMMIAFPPCTHLAVSGARWFPEKIRDGRQQKAIDFFLKLITADIDKIAVENPIGIMSNVWGKPTQIIQPWQFGHGEVKATCLWLKNLPKLIPTDIVEGRTPRVWMTPGPIREREKNRSRTYQGIANAMAEQWYELL